MQRDIIPMANRLLCFTSAIAFSLFISSGVTSSIDMCRNRTTRIGGYYLELEAMGPTISPVPKNTSKTCLCFINATSSNIVTVQISRNKENPKCNRSNYDEAILDSNTGLQTLQIDNLLYFFDDISTMWFIITTHSVCGSNYTINMWTWDRSVKFSHVMCINPQITPSATTTSSPTTLKSTHAQKNDTSSTHWWSNESSTVAAKSNSTSSQTGLIVGVVVGVGLGLILLGGIILAIFILRQRRAKPQTLTHVSQDAPPVNSYESPTTYESVSYKISSNTNQVQTGTLYDNQSAAPDPLATESDLNYYNLQGIDNSSFHDSDTVPNDNHSLSSEGVKNFEPERNSINDADITVIENDLYGK